MKVRWTSESLRLRISPAELDRLQAGEAIGAQLGVGALTWSIRLVPNASGLAIHSDSGTAVITLSASEVETLARFESEGIYGVQDDLRLLVEKDFPCAHPHSDEAAEPDTERFDPSPSFAARRSGGT